MFVEELSQNQINELKSTYLYEVDNDYSTADEIPNATIFEHYKGIDFVNDDFVCTMGTLGNVNAISLATIYDDNGKAIGHCGDTPNVIAFVFANYPQADIIKTRFNGFYTRNTKDMAERILMDFSKFDYDFSQMVVIDSAQ